MEHERLQRFVNAQDEGDAYERALAELRAGRKTSHWMWVEIDAVKLRSSMTLFARAAQIAKPRERSNNGPSRGLGETEVFEQVLERYFGGQLDDATLGLI